MSNKDKDLEQEETQDNPTTPPQEEALQDTPALSESEQRLHELETSLKEQEDKFLRLYAEFDNFRRRSSREKIELMTTAGKDMILLLLPVMDDFDRAVANNEQVEDPAALRDGFKLIQTKLSQLLESQGLKAIEAHHQPFDYELHEAIANLPVADENQKGKVIDQVEKGYYLNDKVIRYAKVVVGQ
ncbi:MAG: nucleotide exchange factor GrpE [Flavobacteriia bacterium]|nr:nucleotide exchange factor GrpE [Flavobacteriia bacterium]